MCRRKELMRKTLNSLLSCMEDKQLISRWVVMDDGSNSKDLYDLSLEFPFLEIYCNDMKGHPNALNKLFSIVRTDFIFHLEDDWLFQTRGNIIQKCWAVLKSDPAIGVVCLRGFKAGNITTADPETTYGIHHYGEGGSSWPGFSLNPGLMDLKKIKKVGEFEAVPGFEWKYARAYHHSGYRLAYLNYPSGSPPWIAHLGRESAYKLNNTTR